MTYAEIASHLFLVRLWSETIDKEQVQWRGTVKYVTAGETRYFNDWSDFVECIQSFLSEVDTEGETS